MKTIMGCVFGLALVSGFNVFAQEPVKSNCHCTDCKCTPESHCGCYSDKGCHCPKDSACSGGNLYSCDKCK